MRRLLEQDAVDDRTDDPVEAPQVDADDGRRDDHDHDALERLVARRPVDLAQLGVRLADETTGLLPPPSGGAPAGRSAPRPARPRPARAAPPPGGRSAAGRAAAPAGPAARASGASSGRPHLRLRVP